MDRQVVRVRFGRRSERGGPRSDAVVGVGDVSYQRGQAGRRETPRGRQRAGQSSLLQIRYELFSLQV